MVGYSYPVTAYGLWLKETSLESADSTMSSEWDSPPQCHRWARLGEAAADTSSAGLSNKLRIGGSLTKVYSGPRSVKGNTPTHILFKAGHHSRLTPSEARALAVKPHGRSLPVTELPWEPTVDRSSRCQVRSGDTKSETKDERPVLVRMFREDGQDTGRRWVYASPASFDQAHSDPNLRGRIGRLTQAGNRTEDVDLAVQMLWDRQSLGDPRDRPPIKHSYPFWMVSVGPNSSLAKQQVSAELETRLDELTLYGPQHYVTLSDPLPWMVSTGNGSVGLGGGSTAVQHGATALVPAGPTRCSF